MCSFQAEGNNWISSALDPNSTKYYDCGGVPILGGMNWSPNSTQLGSFLERTYSNIPTHNAVIFSFSLFVLDTWGPEDFIKIQFDSLPEIDGWGADFQQFPAPICGAPNYNDGIISVYGYIPHSAPSLTLKIISNLDEPSPNEAFGIRDIQLYFTQINPSSLYICGIGDGFTLYNQTTCNCPSNQYEEVSSGNCTYCDDACLSCFGAGPNSCFKCKDGYYFNGNVCTNCHNPCGNCGGPDPNHCKPCLSGYTLYNGSCIFCPSGIIFEGFCIDTNRCVGLFTQIACMNFCISPCDGEPRTTWNESCFPPCLGLDIPDLELTCKGKNDSDFLIY